TVRIVKEAQRVLFARCEAQEEIVSGSARHTAAPFSASLHGLDQWRLGLVECQPFGENGVVTALDQCDQRRLQRHASITCEIRRVTGAPQYPLHFARPVFFLDFDESLQFAQVMGVAQGVQHARHRVIGLPVIVDNDAGDIHQEAAALGADAIEGQQCGGGDMQPLRSAADPKAGFIHVTGAAATWSRTTSAKPWKRRAQSWLIRAMVAVTSFTPRRSANNSTRRFSGNNW